jgi:hypothetical protein
MYTGCTPDAQGIFLCSSVVHPVSIRCTSLVHSHRVPLAGLGTLGMPRIVARPVWDVMCGEQIGLRDCVSKVDSLQLCQVEPNPEPPMTAPDHRVPGSASCLAPSCRVAPFSRSLSSPARGSALRTPSLNAEGEGHHDQKDSLGENRPGIVAVVHLKAGKTNPLQFAIHGAGCFIR